MPKKINKGMKKHTPKKTMSSYEMSGIKFNFDDQTLQKEYVETLEHFKKYDIPFPKKGVGHIFAVGVVRGKDRKKLDKIKEYYDDMDYLYTSGSKHKFDMFKKINKEYPNYRKNLEKHDKYLELLDKETQKFGDKLKYDESTKVKRYNILWYTRANEGGNVVV